MPIALKPSQHGLKTALMALVIKGVLGTLEFLLVVFVDGVVRQVDVHVVDVALVCCGEWFELLSSKANNPFLIQKDLKWITAGNKYIESDVKF